MAASIFDLTSNPELRTLLEKEMMYSPLHEPRFGKWMAPNFVKAITGEVGAVGMKTPTWTGAPIEMRNAFIQEGRTDMLIPIRNELTLAPVFGDSPLSGTAEAAIYGFRKIQINRLRKAYAPPTGMQKQKTKQWAKTLIQSARTDLKKWYSGWTGKTIQMTMYTGYSMDLTQPVAAGGLGITYVSHPSLWVAGTALQIGVDPTSSTYAYLAGSTPGTAGYEAAVQAGVDSLAPQTQLQSMTAKLVKRMVAWAARKKIQQIVTKEGFAFYPIWMKDSAYTQLLDDPEFRDLAKRIDNSSLAKTPLGNGAMAFYAGAAIYSDLSLFCAYTNTIDGYTTVQTATYGPRATTAQQGLGWKFNPNLDVLDTGDYPVSILVGQSALTMGTGEDLTVTDQEYDHGNVVEIGINVIQSMVRNETYDTLGLLTGTTNLFYENTSSLEFMSASPYAI